MCSSLRDHFVPFLLLWWPRWGQRSFVLGKKEKSKAKLTAFVKLTDAVNWQVSLGSDYCGHQRENDGGGMWNVPKLSLLTNQSLHWNN